MKKQIALLVAMLLIVLAFATSCGGPPEGDDPYATYALPLIRGIDEEAGVVCWRFNSISGIWCMTIEQTRLEVGR